MKHEMKLQAKYYNYILNGTKRIELRLNDEKRKRINIGDIIEFQKEPELIETFQVKVTGLLNYDTFDNLFSDFDISVLADKSMSKKELLGVLEKLYTNNKQKEHGVLGVKIELI